MGYYHPAEKLYGQAAGDFFKRLKIPKKLRKLKVGRALAPLAQFIPGPVGTIAKIAGVGAPSCGSAGDLMGSLRAIGGAAGRFLGIGGAAGLEQRAAQFLRSPTGRAVAGGAATAAAAAGAGALISGARGLLQGERPRRRRTVVDITAVRRAVGRLERFEKIARKVVHFTHPTRQGATVARFRKKGR